MGATQAKLQDVLSQLQDYRTRTLMIPIDIVIKMLEDALEEE